MTYNMDFMVAICESLLIITLNDLLESCNDKDQSNLVILDFSKAFDTVLTVPHQKVLTN